MSFPDISKFRNKRILVVGDIMLDEFLYTTSTRTSPEYKDAPVYDINERYAYPGGAANVAMNIKSLQAIPYLVGVIGNDAPGKMICNLLSKADIAQDYLFTFAERKTTTKTRVLNNNTPVFRLDDEITNDLPKLACDFILKNIRQCITDHKPHAILIQDYNKGVLNPFTIQQILSIAKDHHLPVCVDPKFSNWELYQDVELFKPNKNELKVISKELGIEQEELKIIAETLETKIHFRNLLVTLGSEGNFYYNSSESQILPLPSHLSHPDVCGAGDTVIAVATLGFAVGFGLKEISMLANQAGYSACQKKDVQPVMLDELLQTEN